MQSVKYERPQFVQRIRRVALFLQKTLCSSASVIEENCVKGLTETQQIMSPSHLLGTQFTIVDQRLGTHSPHRIKVALQVQSHTFCQNILGPFCRGQCSADQRKETIAFLCHEIAIRTRNT